MTYTEDQLKAAVLAERERCAKICEEYETSNPMNMAVNCAREIRRKVKP